MTTTPIARTEDLPVYRVDPATRATERAEEDAVIARALAIIERRQRRPDAHVFDSPKQVKDYLCLRLGSLEHELFAIMFLDAQHRLIACVEMFRGTLSQASVYPREVVKEALRHNAGAVILAHNHPSGVPEPSRADEHLTHVLKAALALVDVRVLDHLIVSGNTTVSFAERGLL